MNRKRHGCSGAVLLALSTAAWVSASAGAGEIRIWPTAAVTSDTVKLSDIAELQGFDPALQGRLGETVVHAAPRAGGEVLVRIHDVRGALADAEANMASIRVFGASRCKVSKPRAPKQARPPVRHTPRRARRSSEKAVPSQKRDAGVRAGTLESLIRQHISARVPARLGTIDVTFSPANGDDLRLSEPEYQFKIKHHDDRSLGLLTFEIDISRGNRFERTAPVVAEVTLATEIVVARRSINRGQTISGRDIKLETRQFSDYGAIGITDLSAVIGQQCRRFIRRA